MSFCTPVIQEDIDHFHSTHNKASTVLSVHKCFQTFKYFSFLHSVAYTVRALALFLSYYLNSEIVTWTCIKLLFIVYYLNYSIIHLSLLPWTPCTHVFDPLISYSSRFCTGLNHLQKLIYKIQDWAPNAQWSFSMCLDMYIPCAILYLTISYVIAHIGYE